MSDLAGRVAIVTGAARGIGLAIVADFVARGARVVAIDNGSSMDGREKDADVFEAFYARFGDAVAPITRGIDEHGTADAAVAHALDRFAGLDIIVNNAAILRDAFIFKSNRSDYEAVLQANLVGAFDLLRAASGVLRDNAKNGRGGTPYRWGRIVDVVSSAALYGNFGQSAYASAKGGLVALTRIAALDLARSGITANAVAPFAATRVTESIVPATDAQRTYKEQALSVPAEPVARFISYLCSERAQHVTGQIFGVRGREAFVFSQPRPLATIETQTDASMESIAASVDATLAPQFTALETDLDAFATAPLI